MDPTADLRRSCYLLIATVAVAGAVARVVGSENVYEPSRFRKASADQFGPDPDRERLLDLKPWPDVRPDPTPTFGSNDRSRWATVKALAEDGTYRIGRRVNRDPRATFTTTTDYADTGVIFTDAFRSIDRVMDPATGEYFSSKPPLLPTLAAGQYWLLRNLLGWDFGATRWWLIGTILLTVNVLPFAVFVGLVARLAEAHGATDFGKLYVAAAAAFGTSLPTFANTFTNHVPAACCVLFAVYPLVRRPGGGEPGGPAVFASGLFAGLAAAFELPAAALLAGLFGLLVVARPRRAFLWYLPGAAVPVAAHLACNYAALGTLLPAYSEFGGPWYEYTGSHWARVKAAGARGIDAVSEPKAVYAFHLLVGHHGWFSLTPVWVAAAGGLAGQAVRGVGELRAAVADRAPRPWPVTPPPLAVLTAGVSLAVFGFYVARTGNYGGNTASARWLMWLTPLWLIGLIPAADRLGRSAGGRLVACGLLAGAALSAAYPLWNPWRSPWIMQLLRTLGRLDY